MIFFTATISFVFWPVWSQAWVGSGRARRHGSSGLGEMVGHVGKAGTASMPASFTLISALPTDAAPNFPQ